MLYPPLFMVALWGPWASACIFISVSLKWYVTPCGSEHSCWAAGLLRWPPPSYPRASPNRPEHTKQSKQGFHHTPDSRDKHHICPLVTDTDGKIPSSSCVSWLLQLLTKEEKIRQLQRDHSLDPVCHCLFAMKHQYNSHIDIFSSENVKKKLCVK